MKKEEISKIDYTKNFLKQISCVPIKIKKQFQIRLGKFITDSSNPILRDHPLKGEFTGYRSININGDWRALYSVQVDRDKTIIVFEALGTHSQLYG